MKRNEELVNQIGMQFDEAIELFGEETLESMSMAYVVGGATNNGCTQKGKCLYDADTNNGCVQDGCKQGDPTTPGSGGTDGGTQGGGTVGDGSHGNNNTGNKTYVAIILSSKTKIMLFNKKLYCLIFTLLVINYTVIPQNFTFGDERLFYYPNQLKEDADFYFKKINEIHPDPYFFCSLNEYEKKKKDIYDQLIRPMTREEFMWLIAPMNACMDSHTQINISIYNYYIYNWMWNIHYKQGNVFPAVHIEKNRLFIYSDKKKKEIEMINGISALKILEFMKGLYNNKLTERNDYLMKSFFSPYMDLYFNIRAPYIIKYKNNKKTDRMDGISLEEYVKQTGLLMLGTNESKYTIYPHSSIAILNVYNMYKSFSENLNKSIQNFRDSLSKYNIQYVFLDLSNNLGGNIRGFELLDIIPHDTIYESRSIIKKEKEGNKKYNIQEVVRLPYSETKNIKRNLFILQGINTASNADYLCRIIKQNKLGVLIGENTREPTSAFSYCSNYEMPHTKIKFTVASQFIDYSEYFESETLSPDIYWKVNYKYGKFKEEELLEIINYWKNNN